MDGIILNFEHILEIFDAYVIALHWGQAGLTFGLENWKFNLPSVEQMKKKKLQICPSVVSIIGTKKSFPSMNHDFGQSFSRMVIGSQCRKNYPQRSFWGCFVSKY
jgi:hypothetical protein